MHPASVKRCRSQYQNRCIDEQCECQCHCGIERGITNRFAFSAGVGRKGARLHNARMQIKIVRHHRCAKDSYRDVKHFAVAQYFHARNKSHCRFAPDRMREKYFIREARRNRQNQRHHKRFNQAEPSALQRQHDQHIQPGYQHTGKQRKPKQQLQRNRGAQHLRKVAGRNGNFTHHPQRDRHRSRIGFPARLRKIASGNNSQFRRQRLQQHRHQVAQQDHAQQRVTESCAAADIGGPVARIHIPDCHQVARPSERQNFLEPAQPGSDWNTAMRFRKRRTRNRKCGGRRESRGLRWNRWFRLYEGFYRACHRIVNYSK